MGPLSARQCGLGIGVVIRDAQVSILMAALSENSGNGSSTQSTRSGLESCHSSPTMGIWVFDGHNNFIILAVKSIGFGREIVNNGGVEM